MLLNGFYSKRSTHFSFQLAHLPLHDVTADVTVNVTCFIFEFSFLTVTTNFETLTEYCPRYLQFSHVVFYLLLFEDSETKSV